MNAATAPIVLNSAGNRGIVNSGRGKVIASGSRIVQSQTNLLEIVLATHASGRFPRGLNGGEEQGHQYVDNGNDNQQFH
jgi:hypothetical protein